jgi:hypothetical protein
MRHRLLLVACAYLATSTFAWSSASAHTSVGGGGTDDPNADCLRWEAVPVAPLDGSVKDGAVDGSARGPDGGGADAGRTDAGRTDAGTSGATVLVCVEHATMFGCACALDKGTRLAGGTVLASAAILLAALLVAARRPRRAGRKGARR